jgi:hypothetical protein
VTTTTTTTTEGDKATRKRTGTGNSLPKKETNFGRIANLFPPTLGRKRTRGESKAPANANAADGRATFCNYRCYSFHLSQHRLVDVVCRCRQSRFNCTHLLLCRLLCLLIVVDLLVTATDDVVGIEQQANRCVGHRNSQLSARHVVVSHDCHRSETGLVCSSCNARSTMTIGATMYDAGGCAGRRRSRASQTSLLAAQAQKAKRQESEWYIVFFFFFYYSQDFAVVFF